MANLKKEINELISRFDAAQEAFIKNSTDVKKLNKLHKKEVKELKADLKAARVEIEALKAELAIAKMGTPVQSVKSRKTTARRGRPVGSKNKTTAAKRSATQSAIADSAIAKPTTSKPTTAKTTARRGKATAARKTSATKAKIATPGVKRGPGRPRKTAKAPASPLQAIEGFGPAMARQFEAAGVKSPAGVAKLSNSKMAAILATCGPRYRNATPEKMDAYRAAANRAK